MSVWVAAVAFSVFLCGGVLRQLLISTWPCNGVESGKSGDRKFHFVRIERIPFNAFRII